MKTVLTSIFSAIVAGVVLFFAQNWWHTNQTETRRR